MQRRLVAPLLVLTLLAAAAFAAYWTTPRTTLSRSPDDVDHVTLYQNGLAAITLVRPFDAPGGEQVLELALPTTTIFDSITVTGVGVAVKELRSSLAADPMLRPGDRLTVRTNDGSTLTGTYQSQDGQTLLLSKDSGTVSIHLQHVVWVEVAGRAVDAGGPGSTSVTLLVDAQPGRRTVRVSYLAQGVGWSPNYILDPESGAMTFFATLTGMQDWQNVTLDLVAGNPNTVYAPGSDHMFRLQGLSSDMAYSAGGGGATYAPAFEGSTSLGAMHRYHYPHTIHLARGETVRLPVVTGEVEVLRHYYRADASTHVQGWTALPEVYRIRNTLGETLPAGPIRVYLDGEWIGADTLPALGKLEEGNVTVAVADDVKMRTIQVSQHRSDPVYDGFGSSHGHVKVATTYELQVRNLFDDAVDLRAAFHAYEGGTTRVLEVRPAPEETVDGARVWNDEVGAGSTVSYRITVETRDDVYR